MGALFQDGLADETVGRNIIFTLLWRIIQLRVEYLQP
jgi:hypothetical protein